ncbi:hypothetical protein N9X25_07150 [Verrucomicrobiales bacterium]|jgi:hypothetical protein|nr:hypothetical protein [Verrucomicrobiales bacterium]
MKLILQKTFTILGSILGIKRKKPKTKIGRIARRCENAVTITALLYLCVLFFPEPLFGHQLEHEGITLHSTQTIPSERGKALLSQIRSEIRASEIHDEKQAFQIFLCNSKALYTFFAPLSRSSFGITNLFSNIMIANVNLDTNTATAFRSENNKRSFVGVSTHEIGHEMIKNEFGLISAHKAPTWLNEGYCEYISGESSFPEEKGLEMISKGESVENSSFKYFEYRRMVEFCLEKRGSTIKELFSDPPSEQDIKEQTRRWLSR